MALQVVQPMAIDLNRVSMPYVDPIQELPIRYLRSVKDAVKMRLLQLAMRKNPGTKPYHWVIRETLGGDKGGSPADVGIIDMDLANPTTANEMHWEISTTDLGTAGDNTDWMTASSEIDDDTWIAIWAFWETAPEGIPPITDVFKGSPNATLNRILFKRGGSDISHHQVDHVYGYDEVCGVFKEPIIYEPDDVYQVQTNHHDVNTAKILGLRGYTLEKYGDVCAPQILGQRVPAPFGGFEPMQEVTLSEVRAIKEYCTRVLVTMAMNKSVGNPEDLYVRDVLVGEGVTPSTDQVDVNLADTQLAGHERWAVDDDEITAETHSNIIDTNSARNAIKQNTFLAIYGWQEGSAMGSTSSIWFKNSGGVKDWWLTQPCYLYGGTVGGVTKRPIFYDANESLQILLNNQSKADAFPVFRALICDLKGKTVSRN